MCLGMEVEKMLCERWKVNPDNPEGYRRISENYDFYLYPQLGMWYFSAYDKEANCVLVANVSKRPNVD